MGVTLSIYEYFSINHSFNINGGKCAPCAVFFLANVDFIAFKFLVFLHAIPSYVEVFYFCFGQIDESQTTISSICMSRAKMPVFTSQRSLTIFQVKKIA